MADGSCLHNNSILLTESAKKFDPVFITSNLLLEALGQPLSIAKIHILGADAVAEAEGNMDGRVSASVWTAQRGRRTWHVRKFLGREPGDPAFGQPRQSGLVRVGKARSRSR